MAETMKSAVSSIIDIHLSDLDREIKKIERNLPKVEDEFVKENLEGALEINKRLYHFHSSLKEEFDKIPTCEEKYG